MNQLSLQANSQLKNLGRSSPLKRASTCCMRREPHGNKRNGIDSVRVCVCFTSLEVLSGISLRISTQRLWMGRTFCPHGATWTSGRAASQSEEKMSQDSVRSHLTHFQLLEMDTNLLLLQRWASGLCWCSWSSWGWPGSGWKCTGHCPSEKAGRGPWWDALCGRDNSFFQY